MLTSAKNETVKFRDEREINRCTGKRQGCTRKHASGRGSPPSQPAQLLRLHSLRSADTHNTPSKLCGGERAREASLRSSAHNIFPCHSEGGHCFFTLHFNLNSYLIHQAYSCTSFLQKEYLSHATMLTLGVADVVRTEAFTSSSPSSNAGALSLLGR